MTSTIVLQTASVSLLKAGATSHQDKKAASAKSGPLHEILEKADPDKAQALKEKKEDLNRALDTLEASESTLDERRKADARRRIESIRARLEALRHFVEADPGAAAKLTAQLSKELAAAVKEYVAAGGDASSLTLASGSVSPTPAAAGEPASPGPQTPPATGESEPPPTGGDRPSQGEPIGDPIAEFAKTQIAGAGTAVIGGQEETAAFQTEIRSLVGFLKGLLEISKKNGDEQDGQGLQQDIDQAKKDLQKVENILDDPANFISLASGRVSIFA